MSGEGMPSSGLDVVAFLREGRAAGIPDEELLATLEDVMKEQDPEYYKNVYAKNCEGMLTEVARLEADARDLYNMGIEARDEGFRLKSSGETTDATQMFEHALSSFRDAERRLEERIQSISGGKTLRTESEAAATIHANVPGRLGECLQQLGHNVEAVACFEEAIRRKEGHDGEATRHYQLGTVLLENDDGAERAKQAFERAVALDPTDAASQHALGLTYAKLLAGAAKTKDEYFQLLDRQVELYKKAVELAGGASEYKEDLRRCMELRERAWESWDDSNALVSEGGTEI